MAELVVSAVPSIEIVRFVSSGTEATMSAVRLARGYTGRDVVVKFAGNYHGHVDSLLVAAGSSAATLSVPDSPGVTRGTSQDTLVLEFNDCQALEDAFAAHGDRIAGLIMEPVVGNMGCVPASSEFLAAARRLTGDAGALLILDEVMCGMGRTGKLFACTEDGVAPDMITIAKGLGAGYQPIGALLTSAAIYDAIAAGTGFFQHGHTYMGHALAATAANAVLSEILDRDLLAHVTTQGDKLDAALKAQFGDHDNIGDIRGRGLFRGIELVADRSTKAPFDPSRGLAARIKKEAFAAGLICYPMSGTIDGQYGDHVLLAPPFIIEDAQIDELVGKLSTAINKALAA